MGKAMRSQSGCRNISRREFASLGASLLAVSQLMPDKARAQAAGELRVANWGGDWNERVGKAFETPFVTSKGIEIIHELNNPPERKAKLLAERRLPRGSIDVVWLSDADAYEMEQAGVLEPIDQARIPNWKYIDPKLQVPHIVTWIYGGVVLMYNPKMVPEPTSFADLWNPKYENRVGLNDGIYFQYIYAASLSHGGTMGNVDKAFPALLDMKKAVKPRLYPTHQALAAAFQSEEVWISANYSSRIIQWMKEGVPVRWTYPKEGAMFTSFGAGLPKKGLNRDTAYFYLNEMLQPRATGTISELTSYAASTTNAEMSDEVRKRISFTDEQVAKFNYVDYAYAAKNDSKWVEWWNKEFKA
jgi:putative spermidine/putrescine transport system substrate-binding protein